MSQYLSWILIQMQKSSNTRQTQVQQCIKRTTKSKWDFPPSLLVWLKGMAQWASHCHLQVWHLPYHLLQDSKRVLVYTNTPRKFRWRAESRNRHSVIRGKLAEQGLQVDVGLFFRNQSLHDPILVLLTSRTAGGPSPWRLLLRDQQRPSQDQQELLAKTGTWLCTPTFTGIIYKWPSPLPHFGAVSGAV